MPDDRGPQRERKTVIDFAKELRSPPEVNRIGNIALGASTARARKHAVCGQLISRAKRSRQAAATSCGTSEFSVMLGTACFACSRCLMTPVALMTKSGFTVG